MSDDHKHDDAKAPNGPESEVLGYGRPPKAHRFQRGQSGNLAGRPKKALSRRRIVERVLLEKRRVDVDGSGRPRELTTLELAFLTLRRMALEGNHRAFKAYQTIDTRFGQQEPAKKAGHLLVGRCGSWEDWARLFGPKEDTPAQDTEE
jgi:Family of unknown function (DUF5681)